MTQTPERRRNAEPACAKALLFDYRQAANPVRAGLTEPIPYRAWGPELHSQGPSGIIPLDLSVELGVCWPSHQPRAGGPFHPDCCRRGCACGRNGH